MYAALLAALAEGHTVVTANNRLSRTLAFHYNRSRQRAGAQAWRTPDVCTWTQWLQRLWGESRLRGGGARDRVLLTDTATNWLWQQSIAAADPDRPLSGVASLAQAARETWRLVNEWDAVAAPEWTAAGLSPDQQAWLRWAGQFRQRCEAWRWTDPDCLAALLTKDLQAGLFDALGPVWFAGFDSWPPARAALRAALVQRGVVADEVPVPNVAGHAAGTPCADARAELLAAARWARSCISAAPDAAVAVVVPDLASRAGDVRRTFLDIFAPDWRISGVPAGLPLNVSFGQPLASNPAVHTALLLLRLTAERAAVTDFSLLLRSVWLRGAAREYSQRGRLELKLRQKLRQQFALRDALPVCRKYAPEFAATLEVLIEAATQTATRSIRQWAEVFSAQLEAAGWPGDAAVDSDTWQALRAWHELLADFAHSGHVHPGKVGREAALAWLQQLARERTFQPEGNASGVQIMGMLEASGLEFDYLWVCGMARELWPSPAQPSPFVPLDLQRRLQMPDSTAARALDYAGYTLQRLLASTPAITLSWPLQQDGEPLHASPLPQQLLGVALVGAPAGEPWPIWNEQALSQASTETLEDDPPPPLGAAAPVKGGATVMNLQAVSPLNAFIEKRLGAELLEPAPLGIDARERGNAIHSALEALYREYPGRSRVVALPAQQREALLRAALERALAELPGAADAFMQALIRFERDLLVPRLVAFVELDLQRPDFEVLECEMRHDISIGPLQLTLKLDRLDQAADGRKLVIDYKTGRINRQSWNPAKPRDLQLPLYVSTVVPDAAAVAFAQIATLGIGYDGVGESDIGIAGVRAPGSRKGIEVRFQYPQSAALIESWEELRGTWAELLQELARQFAAGDFRLDPRNPESARGQFAVLSRIYDSGLGLYEDEP